MATKLEAEWTKISVQNKSNLDHRWWSLRLFSCQVDANACNWHISRRQIIIIYMTARVHLLLLWLHLKYKTVRTLTQNHKFWCSKIWTLKQSKGLQAINHDEWWKISPVLILICNVEIRKVKILSRMLHLNVHSAKLCNLNKKKNRTHSPTNYLRQVHNF